MSPPALASSSIAPGFPRVSGDEPFLIPLGALRLWFSPRERG